MRFIQKFSLHLRKRAIIPETEKHEAAMHGQGVGGSIWSAVRQRLSVTFLALFGMCAAIRAAMALAGAILLSLAASHQAQAVPVCASTSLQNYAALGDTGCSIDDKIFGGFKLTQIEGSPPDASKIAVSPLQTPFNPGFLFSAVVPFQASGMQINHWEIDYFVRVQQPKGHLIKDLSLSIAGITVTADATLLVQEFACIGRLFPPNDQFCPTQKNLITGVTPSTIRTSASVPIDPAALIDTHTAILLVANTRGTSTLMNITETFSEVPEPSSLILLASGLLAAVLWKAKRLL